jgi:hypothetical protein
VGCRGRSRRLVALLADLRDKDIEGLACSKELLGCASDFEMNTIGFRECEIVCESFAHAHPSLHKHTHTHTHSLTHNDGGRAS